MGGLRPVLLILFSYFAGYLVIQGEISQACHSDVVNAFIYVAGYGIIGITSIASLVHAFRHPHDKPVMNAVKKEVSTTTIPMTPGNPLPESEQKNSSVNPGNPDNG